jgi:Mg-chelatase subunit ChlD
MPGLAFARPAMLLLLALPALWTWASRARSLRSARRSLPRVAVPSLPAHRAAVMALLALAAAGPELRGGACRQALVLALDRSGSVDAAALAEQARFRERTIDGLGGDDRLGIVVFGGEALVERPLSDASRPNLEASSPRRSATDIAGAIELATTLLSNEPGGRIVLVSDGRETHGDAVAAAMLAASRGLTLDAVALRPSAAPQRRELRLEGPRWVRPREPFELAVEVHGAPGSRARLHVSRDEVGASVHELDLDAEGGARLRLPQRIDEPGLYPLRVALEEEGAAGPAIERIWMVDVRGETRVLVAVGGRSAAGALEENLRRAGMAVETASSSRLPASAAALAGYDAILLHGVPLSSMDPAQQRALVEVVRDRGAGLLVQSGPGGLGGAVAGRHVLEEALPVALSPAVADDGGRALVVLILDRSGSMGTAEAGRSRLDAATRASLSLLDGLTSEDALGIVAFDDEAVALLPPAAGQRRERVEAALAGLEARGGTRYQPALDLAMTWAIRSAAVRKHVILLSDGEADPPDLARLARSVAAAGARLSTIALSPQSDQALLRKIAEAGGGEAHYAASVADLTTVFAAESALLAGGSMVERSFRPRPRSHPVLSGLDLERLPELTGYVSTLAKPASATLLESDTGDPLLAAWRFGLGRVVALTVPAESPWYEPLQGWPDFPALWVRTVRWIARPLATPLLQARILGDSATGRVMLEATTGGGRHANLLAVTAEIRGPRGEVFPVRMEQTAPGHYQADFPLAEEGEYLARVSAAGAALPEPSEAQVAAFLGAPEDAMPPGTDLALLRAVARAGQGLVLEPGQALEPRCATRSTWALAPALVSTALAVFLAGGPATLGLRRRWRQWRPM